MTFSLAQFDLSVGWPGRPHAELRQCPIQQCLSGEAWAQHRPVPAEVVAEIPGRHATAAPFHQRLDLAMVRVHSPEPEAALLPPLGWQWSDLHRRRRGGRHHYPAVL